MAKKYIEADALIKSLATETGCMDRVFHAMDVADMVKNFPAADVVEVVRCKDCKWLFSDEKCPLRTYWTHKDNDYCSYGERKDDCEND